MSLFTDKAPGVMAKLIARYHFSDVQAAGILGNLGHESGGFEHLQEISPVAGRGGLGWAQWTGPRRRSFEAWCSAKKLDPKSDEANFGYLCVDLDGTYARVVRAVLATTTLEAATDTFERLFEGAGVPALPSRLQWAQRALNAYRAAKPVTVPQPPDIPKPIPKAEPPKPSVWSAILSAILAIFTRKP